MRKWIVGAAAVFAVLTVSVYYSPHVALWRMRGAIDRGDSSAISSHVDYPKLRENLKATVAAEMSKNVAQERDENLAGALALGALLGGAVVDRVVDAMVTPEALAMMMQGRKPNPQRPLESGNSEPETSMAYEGFSTFVVTVKSADRPESLGIVFTRELLSWKLSAVRLPL